MVKAPLPVPVYIYLLNVCFAEISYIYIHKKRSNSHAVGGISQVWVFCPIPLPGGFDNSRKEETIHHGKVVLKNVQIERGNRYLLCPIHGSLHNAGKEAGITGCQAIYTHNMTYLPIYWANWVLTDVMNNDMYKISQREGALAM